MKTSDNDVMIFEVLSEFDEGGAHTVAVELEKGGGLARRRWDFPVRARMRVQDRARARVRVC